MTLETVKVIQGHLSCQPTRQESPRQSVHGLRQTLQGVSSPTLLTSVRDETIQKINWHILGMKWRDKINNAAMKETRERSDLPSLIAVRRHSTFAHIWWLPRNNAVSQALYFALTFCRLRPSLAALLLQTGSVRRAVHEKPAPAGGRSHQFIHQCLSVVKSLDCSLWRLLRPSAGQARQWVSEWPAFSVMHGTKTAKNE